jgi:PAS domain S-box-containing protein
MMEKPNKPLRVLLIEDVQTDADLLVRLLTRAGFAVEHRRVDSAKAMRQALDESAWDLILSDHNMPGFDAPAALEIYRACALDIPFIVVSGAIGEETAVAMMRAGAHDYLLKSNLGRLAPVIERELREAVTRHERRLAAEALAASEAEYRRLFENAIMAVSQASPDGRLLRVNQAYARMYGYESPAEAMADVHDIRKQLYANAEDRAQVLRVLSEKGFMQPREFPVVRRDGRQLVVLASAREVRDANGNLMCYQAEHVDITERKRAEQDLLRHEKEMAALNQVITATSATLELQRVLDALSDSLLRISGADRASVMLLDPTTDFLTAVSARGPDGPLPVGLRLARGEGGAGKVLETAKPLFVPDVRQYPRFVPSQGPATAQGRPIEHALSYAGFPLVSRGRIIGVASLVGTISRTFLPDEMTFFETVCRATAVSIDNALAHDELRRHAEKLTGEMAVHRSYAENVLGSITDGVASTDRGKKIASWNPGAQAIMGYAAGEAIGKPCREIFRELGADGKPLCDTKGCPFDEIERTRQPSTAREVSSIRRNGQPVALSMSAAPLFDDKGEFQGIVRIFRDFSYERDLLDSIQRANRAKSTFLASMSHEIRTPMNAILGFSQILLKDPSLAANHRQHLDVIARSGEHLLSLIDDILDMSKIDAGRTPLAPSNFNLRGLLTDLAGMFRLRAQAKGLRLAISIADGVPAALLADEKKLRQILINLLGNAIKFTDQGSIRCDIAAERRTGDNLWLDIDVEDTGPGVPPSDAERIFNPFEQAQAGVGGTGLGLAISRDFARLMGGDITLKSEVGKGSRFHLDLPVAVGTLGEPTPVALRPRVVGIRSGLGSFQVLVVDDQPENRLLLVELLSAVGFWTREAADGEAALALAAAWSPHAILMDVRMPGMDGLEAIRRLRADESLRHIPIIAVSASTFDEDRRLALAAGANDFLGKPFREHVLLEKLRASLGIEYVYVANGTEGSGEAPAGRGRVPLPAELAAELRQAANRADYDRLIELLDGLAGTAPEAAAALRRLVERFDYPALLEQIEMKAQP